MFYLDWFNGILEHLMDFFSVKIYYNLNLIKSIFVILKKIFGIKIFCSSKNIKCSNSLKNLLNNKDDLDKI